MKYGTVIRLLTVACLAIVQLTGCSSDVEEMEEAAPGIPIRIVAEMTRGGACMEKCKFGAIYKK